MKLVIGTVSRGLNLEDLIHRIARLIAPMEENCFDPRIRIATLREHLPHRCNLHPDNCALQELIDGKDTKTFWEVLKTITENDVKVFLSYFGGIYLDMYLTQGLNVNAFNDSYNEVYINLIDK